MPTVKDLCIPHCPPCPDICPDPCAYVCNEPCIRSCRDLSAVVYAPPVVVRYPGPILATCPQNSVVGTILPTVPDGPGGAVGASAGSGVGVGNGGYVGGASGSFGGASGKWERYGRDCYANRCECCPW